MTFLTGSFPEWPKRARMAERKWRVRLGAAAELDFANILKWTTENFGRDNHAPIATRLSRRLAGLPMTPMLRARRPATRSRPIFARSTLRGAAVAEVTSSSTAQRRRARSKSYASCATGWTSSATFLSHRTRADIRSHACLSAATSRPARSRAPSRRLAARSRPPGRRRSAASAPAPRRHGGTPCRADGRGPDPARRGRR